MDGDAEISTLGAGGGCNATTVFGGIMIFVPGGTITVAFFGSVALVAVGNVRFAPLGSVVPFQGRVIVVPRGRLTFIQVDGVITVPFGSVKFVPGGTVRLVPLGNSILVVFGIVKFVPAGRIIFVAFDKLTFVPMGSVMFVAFDRVVVFPSNVTFVPTGAVTFVLFPSVKFVPLGSVTVVSVRKVSFVPFGFVTVVPMGNIIGVSVPTVPFVPFGSVKFVPGGTMTTTLFVGVSFVPLTSVTFVPGGSVTVPLGTVTFVPVEQSARHVAASPLSQNVSPQYVAVERQTLCTQKLPMHWDKAEHALPADSNVGGGDTVAITNCGPSTIDASPYESCEYTYHRMPPGARSIAALHVFCAVVPARLQNTFVHAVSAQARATEMASPFGSLMVARKAIVPFRWIVVGVMFTPVIKGGSFGKSAIVRK